jgi:DNA-binding response OmpR family regulator
MNILVVEDEPKMAEYIKKGLEETGHIVTVAFDGMTGKSFALNCIYDVIVSDVNMPRMNGFELVETLRNEGINTPFLLLTAMGTINEKTIGYEAGADDYLVKPFEFAEFILRLNALSKRASSTYQPQNILKVADLELDLNLKVARRGGREIELTQKELLLLQYLIKNKSRVVSRVDIAEKVWGIHFDTGTNTIDVYINFLRKKIDKDFKKKLIHTVIGMGYVLKP